VDSSDLCRDRGITDSEKWIEHRGPGMNAVQTHAHFREPDRKRGRVRPLCCPIDDRLVWDKPVITATPPIFSSGVTPPRDIALVRVFDADRQAIERDVTRFRKMKNVFVAVGNVPF